ncbi:YaiO family outer membrane beta-barrel protein [Salinimicrobium catena]|uniref:YaiO family outer membrane beta-barrel protein n=1 Tax=Salinimicrobium catena TaxID=390640 RepID=UPI002FE4B49E
MKKQFLLYLLFLATTKTGWSQEPPAQTFELAREKAYAGEYEEAIPLLEKLQKEYPRNSDYSIFLARVWSWKQEYNKSVLLLEPLIQDRFLPEAMKLMITVQLWAQDYEEVIHLTDRALNEAPEDAFYSLQKAKALLELDKTLAAKDELESHFTKHGTSPEAELLKTRIYQSAKQEILLSYTHTTFIRDQKDWQQAYVSYKRNEATVSVQARFTYGQIWNRQGTQVEVDAYPKINSRSYLYLNAGTAINNSVFPGFRSGLEYYYALTNSMSFSFGAKYLYFSNNEVFLFTGSLALPLSKNVQLTYRPFLSDKGDLTHTLAGRFRNKSKERFFQVDLQYGTVPYEYFVTGTFTDLKTARAGLRYQFRLSEHVLAQPVFLFEHEEFRPAVYRNRYTGQLLMTFRF